MEWGPRANPAKHPQGVCRIRKAAKPPTAALRFAWGEEEQGSERSFRRQAETELSGLCSDVAGMAGLEPADEGVKVPCLTTWLHPCVMSGLACSRRAAFVLASFVSFALPCAVGLTHFAARPLPTGPASLGSGWVPGSSDSGHKQNCFTILGLYPSLRSIRAAHDGSTLRGKTQAGAATPACRLDVGWVKGLEPSTPGTTIRCSNQLSYTHHITDAGHTWSGWYA